MSETNTDGRMATYLKNNPRKMGVLFTLLLFANEGLALAAASGGSSTNGP